MTQPEALRLAAALIERHGVESFEGDAAAELRRLHEKCEALTADTIASLSGGRRPSA